MKNKKVLDKVASALMALTLFAAPLAAFGQTRISMPKNKYKVEDDVKLGRQAAAEAEKQFPILNDATATNYVESVGQRLVNAIPAEFNQSQFRYTFKVVNARDINAFALPGGPMYVNRGMIEAAKTEGEMAGVMAHEISHVALRHGTAGATKQSSIGSQILGIGAILGGAILAGEAGAQAGALGAQAYFTKFSREYETQADILGSQILARAGYDPVDLANMFRTIEQQGSGRSLPQWLSSHPNPGNRYNRINQEAALLRVSNTPIKVTREFQDVQARLRGQPRAQTMAEIERGGQRNPTTTGGGNTNQTANATYSRTVQLPSTQYRTFNNNGISVDVPNNWREMSGGSDIIFAPEGAYGNDGITHGALIAATTANTRDLNQATQTYLQDLLKNQSNSYLRQSGSSYRTTVAGRDALQTTLTGRSPITGQNETVNIYTVQARNGNLLAIATVAPQTESTRYRNVFTTMLRSLQIND